MHDYAGASACDTDAYGAWCRALLARGVYPPPSQFEAWFPSLAHTPEHLTRTLEAAAAAFEEIACVTLGGDAARRGRPARRRGRAGRAVRRRRPRTRRVLAAIREGYEQHYGEGRVLRTEDRDLALLAGDRLYALGLALLAEQGDLRAVAVLADLISECASAHAEDAAGPGRGRLGPRHVRVARRRRKLPGRPPGDIVRRPSPIGTPVRA